MENKKMKSIHKYDAFICYSRKDEVVAAKLEKTLESFKPPKGLGLPSRNLLIFRDTSDITGGDYFESIETHLSNSAKLIVLCSPDSRQTKYVDDEIQRFVKVNGSKNIIPILLAGIPNNEAKPDQGSEMAFPERLCELLEMPLAIDYRGFDSENDKISKGIFYGQWYTLLANICGISREEIEQRDHKRQKRRRILLGSVITTIFALLSIALIVTMIARNEAEKQKNIAIAGRLAADSLYETDKNYDKALLLASQAASMNESHQTMSSLMSVVLSHPRLEAFLHDSGRSISSLSFRDDSTMLNAIDRSGRIVSWSVKSRQPAEQQIQDLVGYSRGFAFSKNGKIFASETKDGLKLWNLVNHNEIERLSPEKPAYLRPMALSEDGSLFVFKESNGIHLWDVNKGKLYKNQISDNSKGPIVLSSDGLLMAAVSNNNAVILWDVSSGTKIYTSHRMPAKVEDIKISTKADCLAWTLGKYIYRLSITSRKFINNPLLGSEAGVISLAFNPDGKILASGSKDSTITLWEIPQGKRKGEPLKGHKGWVNTLAFSPDGRLLASGGNRGIVILWETVAEPIVPEILNLGETDKEGFEYLGRSPDGKVLAYTNNDGTKENNVGTFFLWNPISGDQLTPLLDNHKKTVEGVVFSQNSRSFGSWDASG